MADTDTARRLVRIKLHPSTTGLTDAYLTLHLEDARAVFYEHTHRDEDPGESLDPLICDIALHRIATEGTAGVKKARDGDMEREYSESGMPDNLLKRMKAYRLVVGVNAADGV